MPRQSESTRRKYAGFSAKNTTAPPQETWVACSLSILWLSEEDKNPL